MKRKRQYGLKRRMLSALLAAAMCLSLFSGMGITGYAVEAGGTGDINLNEDTSGNMTEDTGENEPDEADQGEDERADNEENKKESTDSRIEDPEKDTDETSDNEDNESQEETDEITDQETEITEEDSEGQEDVEESDEGSDIVYDESIELLAASYADIAEEITASMYVADEDKSYEYQRLVISEFKLLEDETLTSEILEAVFQNYSGKSYQDIELQLRNTEDKQINRALYNACIPHLSGTDFMNAQVSYAFVDESGYTSVSWEFRNPKTISGNLNANVSITNEDSEFYLNLPEKNAYAGCADNIMILFPTAAIMDLVDAMNGKFGEEEEMFYLYNSGEWWATAYLQRDGNLYIYGVEVLKETKYLIDLYKESLSAYQESTYGGKTYLYIRSQNGISYDGEQVKAILEKFHSGKKYDFIYITSTDSSLKVDAGIYNAAIPYLKAGGGMTYQCYLEGNYNFFWQFLNPSQLAGDVTPSINLMPGEGKGTVSMSGISGFSADLIGISVMITDNSAAEEWKKVFLAQNANYSLFKDGSMHPVDGPYVYWAAGNGSNPPSQFLIWGLEKLQENVTYTMAEYVYRGDVREENGRKELYLSSMALEKDKFTKEDLTSIINWYKDKEELFDHITIEEKYSSNNLIKKDYFNSAASILKDENSTLSFSFCHNEDNEAERNSLNWHFENCKRGITKDINGNVTYTTAEDYGVTFQINTANTYPPAGAEVQIWMREDSSLGEQFKAALGEPTRSEEEDASRVTLKGTARTNLPAYYSANDDGMWLSLSNIPNWTAKTKYTILPVIETVSFNVGDSITFDDLADRLQVPENASNMTWSSLTTELLSTADGKLSVLDEGEGYVLLSYKVGQRSCMKLYRISISKYITRIVMSKTKLTMDLENGECTEGLDLKIYPAEAGCDIYDPEQVRWASSDESVVEIIKDGENDNRFNGIRAVNAGDATITATYIGENKKDGAQITASCEVKVLPAITIRDKDVPDYEYKLYAITNFDKTLSAVKLPDNWKWANGSTALSAFSGMWGSSFPAVYTEPDTGREVTRNLYVRMITITGIRICQVDDSDEIIDPEPFIEKGDEETTITYRMVYRFASNGPECEEEWEDLNAKFIKAGYKTVWSSNPKNLGAGVDGNSTEWQFTVDDKTAKGKKTFTVTIQDSKKKKVFAASHSLTVTEKPFVEFPNHQVKILGLGEYDSIFYNEYDEDTGKGKLTITIPKDQYSKLTVTSKDTAILKIGKISVATDDENVVTTVPYERKGYGIAPVVISAADERKSSCMLQFHFVDSKPKLLTPKVTLNKKIDNDKADILIQCELDYRYLSNDNDITIEEKYQNIFNLSYEPVEDSTKYILSLSLNENTDIKKGNYKVKIKVPLINAGEKVLTVTVSIVETLPSVTMKQTKKVNTFYTDEEGYGLLSITAKEAEVYNVWLDNKCDYELAAVEDGMEGEYIVKLKEGATGKVKKGTLSYSLVGYQGTYTKSFTISTVNTKPAIVLSQKSDTLYPNAGYGKTSLILTDKVTGEPVGYEDIKVKDAKDKEYKEFDSAGLSIKGSNKNYYVISEGDDGGLNIQLEGTQIYSCTDKIPFKIQKDNWSSAVDVTYSVIVDTKAPKLKLSQATLTLNKNEDIYGDQQVKTKISLSGRSDILVNSDEVKVNVYFTGKDKASTNALKVNGNLVLQYWDDRGCIIAKFNDNELKTGTYKYNVCAETHPDPNNREVVIKAATVLTIKVVDKKPAECISVSTKGSIDLLNREGTGIAVTPKLSNVTGTIENGWLTGRDEGLFDASFENGKLYIKARKGEDSYSTKHTYKVKAVFWVQTEDYHGYKLVSKELSFKVKQGNPKIKISSKVDNTLYRTASNTIELKIEAWLGTKEVEIDYIDLVNYTEDLKLVLDNNTWAYDQKKHTISITTTDTINKIMQSGKTQSVKLAIHYVDQAGDVKDTQVTYKVVIR